MTRKAEVNKQGVFQGTMIEENGNVRILENDVTVGANLVKGSFFTSDYNAYTTVDTNFLFNGMPTLKISTSGNTSNTYRGYSQTITGLKAKDHVTVTVWVYRKDDHGIDSGCEMRLYQTHNDGSANNWTGFTPSTWPNNTWIKLQKTYILDNNFASGNLSFDVIKNGTYWISAPKVELGDISTPWVPHVEDITYTRLGFASTNPNIHDPIKAEDFYEI